MYLKKLEMRGFKTFADRTELEFGPGITAIVGPNGVGKSNIADGILWSLGEQSNRALRTETFQDVIFAGSEDRRPIGMVEVALTVDNSDGALPVDYSEIVISRRLFRSGESEYLLNRSTTRLRDIRDLLLDTGVGPGAYSVIGQGEIDAILSIRSEDRRELLEEVAGIRKYRVRRDEATRKLEATEANMTRVTDIVAELRAQREPLEKEAEVARQYNEMAETLRELELHLLAGDYQRRRKRLGKLTNDLEITRADLQGTRNRLSQLDGEHERVQFELARLGDEVDRRRDEAGAAERELDQTRQAQALSEERIRAAVARQEDLGLALESHTRRSEELSRQLTDMTTEHEAVAKDSRQATEDCAELEKELTAKSAELEAKTEQLRELEGSQAEMLERATALENEALALQSLESDLAERAERLSRQSEALAARELEIQDALTSAEARREELASQLQSKGEELGELRNSLGRASKTLQEHRQKCNVFSGAVTAAEAREELLQELQRSREGFTDGVKAAIRAAGKGDIEGVRGIVADLIDVPARFERAIEAALGDALQWVVTETEEQAAAGADYALKNAQGRVTFVPLSGSEADLLRSTREAPSFADSLGPAIKAVRVKREYAKLLARLLGDTIIVKDLNTALTLRQRTRTHARLVTLAGEVVSPDGAVTVGGEEGAGAQAFERRRELQALSRELKAMRASLAEMWKREEHLDQWCARLTDQIHALEAELSKLQSDQVGADSDAAHLLDQQKATRQATLELSQEAEALGQRLEQARSRRQNAETESEQLRSQGQDIAAQIERVRAAGVGQAEVEALRARHVSAQVRSAELAEKERSALHLKDRYTEELKRAHEEITTAESELVAARESEEKLREEVASPDQDMAALEQKAADARAAVNQGAQDLSDLREKSAQMEQMRGRITQVAQEQTDRIHRSELALAREEAQLEHIAERLQDIYDMSPEEAFGQRDEEVRETDVRQEANELRERIRALGPVSISAIDECERLRAREEFLDGQLADLQAAKDDLQQVIREIDEAATGEFLDCFERMKQEFQVMFARLFEGGQTELRLTDPDNPLDGGVDVIVQVPGKRQQNLLLLSGGERALTALALVFAMLRVKPTPFCVMDEIDAALDEANVGRFVEVLKEFTQESQFIIVTHNPHTIEAADVLFGVTMEQAGVSQLIKLELRDWEEFLAEAESQVATARAPHAGTRVLPTST